MGRLIAPEGPGQIILDLLLGIAAVLIAELHADAGRALALRALWRHPNDPPRNRQLFLFAHEIEQHEYLVAQTVVAVRGYEQAAVLHERHIRKIERALILDRKGQEARFVTWTSQDLKFPSKASFRQRGSTAEQQGLECQLLIDVGRRETPKVSRSVQQLE